MGVHYSDSEISICTCLWTKTLVTLKITSRLLPRTRCTPACIQTSAANLVTMSLSQATFHTLPCQLKLSEATSNKSRIFFLSLENVGTGTNTFMRQSDMKAHLQIMSLCGLPCDPCPSLKAVWQLASVSQCGGPEASADQQTLWGCKIRHVPPYKLRRWQGMAWLGGSPIKSVSAPPLKEEEVYTDDIMLSR